MLFCHAIVPLLLLWHAWADIILSLGVIFTFSFLWADRRKTWTRFGQTWRHFGGCCAAFSLSTCSWNRQLHALVRTHFTCTCRFPWLYLSFSLSSTASISLFILLLFMFTSQNSAHFLLQQPNMSSACLDMPLVTPSLPLHFVFPCLQ